MRYLCGVLMVVVVCKYGAALDDGEDLSTSSSTAHTTPIVSTRRGVNCTAAPKVLKIDQRLLSFYITWDLNIVLECYYRYSISIEPIAQPSVKYLSNKACDDYVVTPLLLEKNRTELVGLVRNYDTMEEGSENACRYEYDIPTDASRLLSNQVTVYYHVKEIYPCTRYRIELELMDNREEVAARSFDIIETDSIELNQTENLSIKTATTSLFLSWKPPKYADICRVAYDVYMVKEKPTEKDVPYYKHESRTLHKIRNLDSCTSYNVSVVPSNAAWTNESNYENPKDVPHMVHTVSTLPEEVTNVEVEFNEDGAMISWTPPTNTDCIESYKVTVNKATYMTTDNTVTIDYFPYCEDIAVTSTSYDNSTGKAVHVLKPGAVRQLNSHSKATSVTISWSAPLNGSCVEDYIVRLNDKLVLTKLLEYTFENLTSCSVYEMQVSAKSIDSTVGTYVSIVTETSAPQEVGPPVNFTGEYENNTLTLNWESPINAQACNVSYNVSIKDNDNNEILTAETSETFYTVDFNLWVGCLEYSIFLTPYVYPTQQSRALELKKKISKVRVAPTCQALEVTKDSAILECNIGTFQSNLCSLYNIAVVCKPIMVEKVKSSKKLNNVIENYKFKENPQNPIVLIKLEGLGVFTNYSCISFVTNSAGRSPPSAFVSFRTKEKVPDAPQFLRVVDLTNTSFTLNWRPPDDIQGELIKYQAVIEYKGPTYFLPQNCTVQEKKKFVIDVDFPQNEYSFTKALPASLYSVYIQAVNGAGTGERSSEKTVVTNGGVPDEPRNVDFRLNKSQGSTYDVNVTITWWYPCFTNGLIKQFTVNLFHISKNHQNHIEQRVLTTNADEPQLNFTSNFRLLPAFEYLIIIGTKNQENLESHPLQLTFTSPESYPEAPILKEIINVTQNTFVMSWSDPPNPNGVLTNYTINVFNNGSLHKVPKDCLQETVNNKFIQSSNLTWYKFEGGLPNHRYNVTISAATKVGYGPISEPIVVETSQSESEEVRDARLILNNAGKEEYNVTCTISFKYPCNTNGQFRYFLVNLFGSRTNLPIHKNRSSFEGFINQENTVTFNVLPAHNYIVNIEVVTDNYHSEPTSIAFLSPAGIPLIVNKDISSPMLKSLNVTYTKVVLDRNMFSQVNGPILYYAVIVASDINEVQSQFGVWDGINWPQVQYGFSKNNAITTYQATPNFWNPFDDNDITSYTFTIGDSSLSKTNVPLQPNGEYKVLIRAFTQNGYSDSTAVYFIVPGVDDSNLALIVGLVFGIIGTIFLVVIALICKRRQQWLARNKSVKLIPLTPLSISIEHFPDYYTKIKSNNDMLKEEFVLLGRKSNEIAYPMYEAVRPENKKKNRYNNVLPYDRTRVTLDTIEENSDYINASYVLGYSNQSEYIATQGPLEHTCQDFWKMVLQENCSLIVMITQFIELNKQKCFKYFPDNHEKMDLENGIAIRCCTELSFKSYTVRTILVQQDLRQWTITHLQYTEWPDFGCPEDTEATLEFSQLIRKHAEQNDNPIIVHCSAGVGRTGTLIALDILFQALANQEDIDVFGTVLNLRKDRKNMVQTEKQYLFIHECVNIAIINPERLHTKSETPSEAIYENVEEIKLESINNGVSESAF